MQTGKGSGAEKREMCLKRENKVRGWEEHGGREKAETMRLEIDFLLLVIPPLMSSLILLCASVCASSVAIGS